LAIATQEEHPVIVYSQFDEVVSYSWIGSAVAVSVKGDVANTCFPGFLTVFFHIIWMIGLEYQEWFYSGHHPNPSIC